MPSCAQLEHDRRLMERFNGAPHRGTGVSEFFQGGGDEAPDPLIGRQDDRIRHGRQDRASNTSRPLAAPGEPAIRAGIVSAMREGGAPPPEGTPVVHQSSLSVDEVWAEFGEGLRSFVRRRVVDPHEAEDLLSEIVVRVHRRLDTLDHQERLTAWVFRIARNVIKDYYKSAGRW